MRNNVQKVIESLLSRLGTGTPGLMLLPAITGMGKSYAASQLIINQLRLPRKQRNWKRIFYITPRKDNLPKDLLSYHSPDAEKIVIYVNSLQENFMSHWREVSSAIVFYKLNIDSAIIKRLDKAIDLLISQKKNPVHGSSHDEYFSEQFSKAERGYRKALKSVLKKKLGREFHNLSAKVISDEQNLGWIAKLYPAQVLEQADFTFLSAKMAIGPLARIDGSVRLDEFLEGSLVILDEFDSIKEQMLDHVVEVANKRRYHVILTLRKLISALNSINPPAIFPKSTMSLWDDLLDDLNKFYDRNRLIWPVKLNPELEDASRRFMASDYQFTTYIKGDSRVNLIVRPNNDHRVNSIDKASHSSTSEPDIGANPDPHDEEQSLIGFLVDCRIRINRVAQVFRFAAESRSKEIGQEYNFIFEEYFVSICNHFSLDTETRQTLLHIVQNEPFKKQKSRFSEPFKARMFIQKGLQVTEIIDSPQHSTHSRFQEISLYPVPEAMLLAWCDKAQVLGMSATAVRETAIGNFHLGTLRSHLGDDRFIVPNQMEHDLLRQLYDSIFAGYRNGEVAIHVHRTDIPAGSIEPDPLLVDIVGSSTIATRIHRCITAELDNRTTNDKGYSLRRYLRIVKSLCHFRDNPDIPSALFVLNAHPSAEQGQAISYEVVKYIMGEVYAKESPPYLAVLKAQGFADQLQAINSELAAGKRVVAFSTYSTIGKGVNIQHVIPPGLVTIKINAYEQNERMDWPMIHLDAPTNLLPSLVSGGPFGTDNLKALMQFEYLVLCGAISYPEIFRCFASIFQNRPYKHPQHTELFNVTIREVIQALGRLSRTNVKLPTVHIMVEKRLLEIIHFDQRSDDLAIPEYKKLLEESHLITGESPEGYQQDDLLNDAVNITLETEKKKQNLLDGVFAGKKASIDTYKSLRQTLIRTPVTDNLDEIPDVLRSAYIRIPESAAGQLSLFYSKRGDKVTSLSFSDNGENTSVFSEEASGLPKLIAVPEVDRYFSEKAIARKFRSGHLVFSPALFDMYKGAIGETAGKILLEKFCGLQLTDLPDEHFEQFDYLLTPNPRIAVDFKFFLVLRTISRREYQGLLQRIDSKRIEANLDKVYIINILAETNDAVFTVTRIPQYPAISLVPFVVKGNSMDPHAIEYLAKELT
jgi:hypothetical protein